MVPVNIIITGMVAIVVMSGCTKKKSPSDKDFTATPPTTTPAASQDIFDEFYKEDTGQPKVAESKPVKKEPVVRSSITPEFTENGRYVVQISTVRSRSLADDVAAKLTAKGYPAYVAQVDNPTPSLSGTYYRVRVGGFNAISKARSFGENTLSADGFEYWVDNRSNDNVGLQGGSMGGGDTYYTSQPAPSYSEPEVATPAPAPKAAPSPAPAPASQPQQEFNATPAPAAPMAPADADNEWGNEGW